MKPALAAGARRVELEKPELDRALREGRVQVEHVVAAAVVMIVAVVGRSLRGVPNLGKLAHGLRLASVKGRNGLSENKKAATENDPLLLRKRLYKAVISVLRFL